MTPLEEARVQKKVADNICARCRRPFGIGDRVQPAYILYDPNAHNPNLITERGMQLGVDHEFVHVSCEDPYLEGKLVNKLNLPSRI